MVFHIADAMCDVYVESGGEMMSTESIGLIVNHTNSPTAANEINHKMKQIFAKYVKLSSQKCKKDETVNKNDNYN